MATGGLGIVFFMTRFTFAGDASEICRSRRVCGARPVAAARALGRCSHGSGPRYIIVPLARYMGIHRDEPAAS
jgi:hypothetical protein